MKIEWYGEAVVTWAVFGHDPETHNCGNFVFSYFISLYTRWYTTGYEYLYAYSVLVLFITVRYMMITMMTPFGPRLDAPCL